MIDLLQVDLMSLLASGACSYIGRRTLTNSSKEFMIGIC